MSIAAFARSVSVDPRRRRTMPRWLRLAAGFGFLVLGLVGIAIPVMPQFAFLTISALLFAPDFPPARRLCAWLLRRWPSLRKAIPKRYRDMARSRG